MGDVTLSQKKTLPFEQVKKLLESSDWGHGRTLDDIGKQIHASDLVFSVWEGSQLAAFCRVLTDYSYVVSIWDFTVAKDYQGQGVGGRLLKAILGHPDLFGIKRWALFTPLNADFFEQHGFLPSEETLIRYG